MKDLINRAGWCLVGGVLLTVLLGAIMDLKGWLDQPQRPEKPATSVHTATQPPAYTGPSWCLEWGAGQPESCRGNLPECLAEDGSGPGVMCWFTDPDYGKLWLQYGDD